MKLVLTFIFLAISLTDPTKIGTVNQYKKDARNAYTEGNFELAIEKFNYLIDSLGVTDDPNIKLNLANAHYQLKDSASTAQAFEQYNSLTSSKDKLVRSVASQQLGIMLTRQKKFEEALEQFKDAIKANPSNDEARYNYEMVKKLLEEQKKKEQEQQNQDQKDNKEQQQQDQQQQDQQNKDQQNKENKDQQQDQKEQDQQDQDQKKDQQKQDQQNKDQQKQDEQNKEQQDQQDQKQQEEQQKKDEQQKQNEQQQKPSEEEEQKAKEEAMKSLAEKLKEMKMSEEKAKMILEALKNNEIQYIQQQRKKATKRKDTSKPDW